MEAEEPTEYSKSRLRYFYFRIPLSIEWQTRLNGKGPLFFAVGPEAEIRHGFRSKAKVNGSKKTIDKGLNGRPARYQLTCTSRLCRFRSVYALLHLRPL